MSGVALAIGGAGAAMAGTGLYSAGLQSKAAGRAQNALSSANDYSNYLANKMYTEEVERQRPWLDTGRQALYSLSNLMGISAPGGYQGTDFGSLTKGFDYSKWQDPGYDFRLSQGIKALEAGSAARGDYFSGAAGKELAQYGQDYGSNEFMNAYNRWNTQNTNLYNRFAGLAGAGQQVAQQMGQAGQNYANQVGGNMFQNAQMGGNYGLAQAQAMGSGYENAANQLMGGLGTYLGYKQQEDLLGLLKK